MSVDDISVGSTSTCSTSSTAAVATPLGKYRKNKEHQPSSEEQVVASPEASVASPSGAATVTTILSNGGSILEQKRLRKRMALMEMERNRGLNASLSLTSSSERGLRTFDQSQHDKAILQDAKRAVASSGHSVASFNPNSCFESDLKECVASDMAARKPSDDVVSDKVSELRRRRLYEMHHNRPYSQTKPKKKFKFWEQEKPTPFHQQPQQMYLLKQNPHQQHQQCVNNFNGLLKQSASFSDYERYREPSTLRDDSIEHSFRTQHEFDVNWIHPMSKLRMVHTADEDDYDEDEPSFISTKASPRVLWNETSALQTQMEALALGQQTPGDGAKRDDDRDEIMGGLVYDFDEIMTPVKVREHVAIPININADETTFAAGQEKTCLVSPDASALITPLLEAVTFETPEKISAHVVATSTTAFQNSLLESDVEDVIAEITPTNSADEVLLSPPNAPKKERIHKTPSPDEDEVAMKVENMTATPATVGTAPTISSTPASDVIPMDQSADVSMLPMAAVKLSVNPDSGIIQWQSLYRDEKGEFSVTKSPEENPTKVASLHEVTSAIEALSERKVQSADGTMNPSTHNNMLKLFTHLYQQLNYDEIVESVPEIENQSALVIARGLDFSASTYYTAAEVKALLEALKNVDKLDSIMLLNFRPESMVDLAKTLNQHPSLYRLQIHLAEGTINGELLGVMATAPRLTHLQLDLKESCAIGTLINSKSLQTLRVTSENVPLDKAHVRTLIYGLGSNTTLTALDLAPEMSIEHFRSMCSALRENKRLESLRVSLKLTTESESQIATLELANLLKKNRSLVSVWNHAHEKSSPPPIVGKRILQEALKKNSRLKEIKFFSEDFDDSFLVTENPESFVLGIQPRQQDIIFNHHDDPSTVCSTSYTSCGNDSYSKDAECDVVPSAEFCGMLHTVSNSLLKDCVWPDVSSMIGGWKERENNNRKKNESSTSLSVL